VLCRRDAGAAAPGRRGRPGGRPPLPRGVTAPLRAAPPPSASRRWAGWGCAGCAVGGGRTPGGWAGATRAGGGGAAPPLLPLRPRSSLPPSCAGGVHPAQRSASAAASTAAAAVSDAVQTEWSPRPAAVATPATAVRPPAHLPTARWGWRRGRSAGGPPPGHASRRRCGRPPHCGGADGRGWSAMDCRPCHWRGRDSLSVLLGTLCGDRTLSTWHPICVRGRRLQTRIGLDRTVEAGRSTFVSRHRAYSRSPKNPTLQLSQESAISASTTPHRPIWNTFGTVAVRDFWENGCRKGCHSNGERLYWRRARIAPSRGAVTWTRGGGQFVQGAAGRWNAAGSGGCRAWHESGVL